MSLDERLLWLLVGCVIGFFLGYFVRTLREIKEELGDVDERLKKEASPRKKNDRGSIRDTIVMELGLLLVVLITIYAAFSSQKASNEVHDQQKQQARVISCTNEYLVKTISALNERTTYSQDSVDANVKVQGSLLSLLQFLTHVPPYSQAQRTNKLQDYVATLNNFVSVSGKNSSKVSQNPYPTSSEFTDCVNHVIKENK